MAVAPGGDLARYDGGGDPGRDERESMVVRDGLVVVHQDELIKGRKYAQLRVDTKGQAYFIGTAGYYHPYRTESYATCAMGKKHKSPVKGCSCGFWVPMNNKTSLSQWSPDTVALEVEIGGRIIDCGYDILPAPAWGYRAEWQRVLSVSLHKQCGVQMMHGGPCVGPVNSLVIWGDGSSRRTYDGTEIMGRSGQVLPACARHSMLEQTIVIDKPVSWLRRSLQTEIRPGPILDVPAAGVREWRDAIREVTRQLCPLSQMLYAVPTPPEMPDEVQHFHVCADVRTKLTYDLAWDPAGQIWRISAIYHPLLAPWGWGEPGWGVPGTVALPGGV